MLERFELLESLYCSPIVRHATMFSKMPEETGRPANQSNTTAANRILQLLLAIRKKEEAFYTLIPSLLEVPPPAGVTNSSGSWNAIRAQKLIAEMLDDYVRELADARLPETQQAMSLRCLVGVVEALSPANMNQQRTTSLQRIRDIDLVQLEFVDVLLREHVAEKELTTSDLSDLLQAVRKALGVLETLQLPLVLRDFCSSQLLGIETAIQQYKFRGMRGIEEALVAYMGSYDAGRLEASASVAPESKTTLKEVFEVGQTLVNLARGVAWLYPHAVHAAHEIPKLLGQ